MASDPDGNWSLSNIPAGSFKVFVTDDNIGNYPVPSTAWQFWDGAVTAGASETITLGEGESRSGINSVLSPGASISGTVRDGSTGALITQSQSLVILACPTGSVLPDDMDFCGIDIATDGAFAIDRMPASSGNLIVYTQDSLGVPWADVTSRADSAFTLSQGGALADRVLRMSLGGRISGDVTWSGASPPEDAKVCFSMSATAPATQWTCWRLYNGAYESIPLSPGSYYVRVNAKSPYLTTYFNNSATAAEATSVLVTAGTTRSGVNVSLRTQSVPGAPSVTSVTAANGSVSVAFTAPASSGGSPVTNVEYSTDNGASWVARSPVSTASPLVITGLVNGTAYQVRLRAVNAAGAGAPSGAVSVTPRTVPGAPSVTSVTAGNGSVSVAFTAPASNGGSAVTNYQYSTNNGASWVVRSPVSAVSPLVITGLANGTGYLVRLRAVNAAGSGAASDAVSVTPRTVPGAPTGLVATAESGSVSVAFTAPAASGGSAVTSYQYSVNNGTSWAARSPVSAASPLVITGLVNGTTYQVRLRAVNAAGAGAASSAVSVTPRTVPGAPSLTSVTAGNGSVSVAFTAPAASGGSAITNVEYSVNDGASWVARSPVSAVSPLVITGLANGRGYLVRLRAVNAAGSGAASSAVSVTPRTVPGAPSVTSVTAGNGQASVAFTASAASGGSPVTNVEYSVNNGASWVARSPVSTASPLVITGLVNGTTYLVRLRAVNAAGAGAASSAVSVTPRTVPGAPSLTSVMAGNGSVSVAFTAPAASGGAVVTNVEYSTDNGTSWTARNPASAASPLVITGLANGTGYLVRLRAVNAAGAGAPSSALSVTPRTTPGAPTAVVVVPQAGGAAVSWAAPGVNGGSAVSGFVARAWAAASGGASPAGSCATTGALACSIPGLVNGTGYFVDVTAVNAAGGGEASSPRVAVTPRTVPVAPTGLVATVGSGSVSLAFAAPAASGGSPVTNVEYSVNNGTSWVARSPVSAASPLVITGLVNGTAYLVRLRAVNAAGSGAASSAVSVTPRTAPGAPTGLVATPGNGSVSIAFAAPASSGGSAVTSYEYSTNNGSGWVARSPVSVASPLVITGLFNGTAYLVRLRAVSAAGPGAASAAVPVTPRTIPGAPSGVVVVPQAGGAAVSWAAPGVNGGSAVSGFVARAWAAVSGGTDPAGSCATTGALACTITGLVGNETYYVDVIASNAGGVGPTSSPRRAVLIPAVSDSISGRVSDESTGEPVPGVSIRAVDSDFNSIYSTTDSSGRYVFSALPAGPYIVGFSKDGYVDEYFDNTGSWSAATLVEVTARRVAIGIDARLAISGSIMGTVIDDATGKPVAGASVVATSAARESGGFAGGGTTDEAGRYTITGLHSGQYYVRFDKDGYSEYFNNQTAGSAMPVTVVSGKETRGIDAGMLTTGSITGTVSDDQTDAPLVDVTVYAVWQFSGSRESATATTDASGRYTIEGLPAHGYQVRFFKEGYASEAYGNPSYNGTTVWVSAGRSTSGIDAGLASNTGWISGTVTNAGTGEPLAGVAVYADAGEFGSGYGHATSDASGRYTISLPRILVRHGQEGYRLRFAKDNYATDYFAYPVPVGAGRTTTDIDMQLRYAGSIMGKVRWSLDPNDPGDFVYLEGVTVTVEGGPRSSTFSTTTNEVGSYEIPGLPPGAYTVRMSKPGYVLRSLQCPADYWGAYCALVEGAGEAVADAVLVIPGGVTGRVLDARGRPAAGVVVGATGDGNAGGVAYTDSSGWYTVSGLHPQEYAKVHFTFGGYESWYWGRRGWSEADSVRVRSRQNTRLLDIGVPGEASITGVVTDDATGRPLVGATVGIGYVGEKGLVVTDASGLYAFTGLEPGTYDLWFAADEYVKEKAAVDTSSGVVTKDMGLREQEKTGTIAGTVTDDMTGKPLVGVSVQAWPAGSGAYVSTDASGAYVSTDASGRYTITGLSSGSYWVSYFKPSYESEYHGGFPYPAPPARPVEVMAGRTTSGIDARLIPLWEH